MPIEAVAQTGIAGYVVLFAAVAASWIGIPIIGAGVLAAAGVLASDGEMNIWLVIVVATAAAEIGGYVGYLLGARAGDMLADGQGPLLGQRRRAMIAGARVYRRWGWLAVFVTPTFVSGALKMQRSAFLFWNALAAVASTSLTAFGAYGIGSALVGHLSARRGLVALVVGVAALLLALGAAGFVFQRRRRPGATADRGLS